MITKVQKWGNSLGIRIPKPLAQEVHLQDGTPVELRLDGERLIISSVRKTHYELEELLSRVTPDNIHSEVDTGPAVGQEVW